MLGALGAVMLAGCNQAAESNAAANNAAANAASAKPKGPTYCFFKPAETKGWTASRDARGNVVVKGQAFRSDSRYRAEFIEQDVTPDTATLWVAIGQNTTGYAAPENWWDVTTTIPDSGGIENVTVKCGKTTLAELKVAKRG